MTETDFDAFEEFAGYGPKSDKHHVSFDKWCSEREHLDRPEKISMATAIEYLSAMFSHPPLIEHAQQIAHRNREVSRAQAAGLDALEAVAIGNERFPMDEALGHMERFLSWFFYQRNIWFYPLTGSILNMAFRKMVADNAQPLESVMRAYLMDQPGIDELIYATDLEGWVISAFSGH